MVRTAHAKARRRAAWFVRRAVAPVTTFGQLALVLAALLWLAGRIG